MPEPHIRRIVTGHDATGKAVVIADGAPPLVHTDPRRPGYSSTDLWRPFCTEPYLCAAGIVAREGLQLPGLALLCEPTTSKPMITVMGCGGEHALSAHRSTRGGEVFLNGGSRLS